MIISTAIAYNSPLPADLAAVKMRARISHNALDAELTRSLNAAAKLLRDILRSPLADYECTLEAEYVGDELVQTLPYTGAKPTALTVTLDAVPFTGFHLLGSNPSRLFFTERVKGVYSIAYSGAARADLGDALTLLAWALFEEPQKPGTAKAARDSILLAYAPASAEGY